MSSLIAVLTLLILGASQCCATVTVLRQLESANSLESANTLESASTLESSSISSTSDLMTNDYINGTDVQTPPSVNVTRNLQYHGGAPPPMLPPPMPIDGCGAGCMEVTGDCGGQPQLHGAECGKYKHKGASQQGNFQISFGGSWDYAKDFFMEGLSGLLGRKKMFQPHVPVMPRHHQLPPQQVVEHMQVLDVQPVQYVETPVYVEAPPIELVEFVDVEGPPILEVPCGASIQSAPCSPVAGAGGVMQGFDASGFSATQQNIPHGRAVAPPPFSAGDFSRGKNLVSHANQPIGNQPRSTDRYVPPQQFYYSPSSGNSLHYGEQQSRQTFIPGNQFSNYQSRAYSPYTSSGYVDPNLLSQYAQSPTGRRINRLARHLARNLVG